jgi:hypothetical protein
MLTVLDDIELKKLRREFEEVSLMAKAFPKKIEFIKRADALELLIHSREVDNRYI